MSVYKAINAVQADLCKEGITKDSKNTFDGYNFRGIDAVYNALSPLLAKHGLCILPRMLSRSVAEHQSQKGGILFYVTVDAEFDFVCSEDGSKHTVKTFGEAMDRGDKATNKAMSAAYKYAAFQTFAIPTEGDNDADAQSYAVASKGQGKGVHKPTDNPSFNPDEAEVKFLSGIVAEIIALESDPAVASEKFYGSGLDNDEQVYIWNALGKYSALRRAMKEHNAALLKKEGN